jgi:hypothetical protein
MNELDLIQRLIAMGGFTGVLAFAIWKIGIPLTQNYINRKNGKITNNSINGKNSDKIIRNITENVLDNHLTDLKSDIQKEINRVESRLEVHIRDQSNFKSRINRSLGKIEGKLGINTDSQD